MIKKTVSWKDLLGEKHTEDLYFHIMEVEAVKLEISKKGGLVEYLQTMVQAQDQEALFDAFEKLIATGYGRRSEDGRRHDKDPAWTKEFLKSPAYNALFMDLVTNEQNAIEFIVGMMPDSVKGDVDMEAVRNAAKSGTIVNIPLPGEKLYVPPMEELKFPPEGVTPDPEPFYKGDVPEAFRRQPPKEPTAMIESEPIELPKALADLTREELLRAYDAQMAKQRDERKGSQE